MTQLGEFEMLPLKYIIYYALLGGATVGGAAGGMHYMEQEQARIEGREIKEGSFVKPTLIWFVIGALIMVSYKSYSKNVQ